MDGQREGGEASIYPIKTREKMKKWIYMPIVFGTRSKNRQTELGKPFSKFIRMLRSTLEKQYMGNREGDSCLSLLLIGRIAYRRGTLNLVVVFRQFPFSDFGIIICARLFSS